ncbi:MAG: YbcC family protein [Polymorphobacter sp.]
MNAPVPMLNVAAPADRAEMTALITAACNKIAPLSPLKHFVAVNPFLGFTADHFAETCATLRRVARTDMLMPRAFYREAIAAGVIDDIDLAASLVMARADALPDLPVDVAALRGALDRYPQAGAVPHAVVATVAEVLDRLSAGDRQASRTAFMVDEIAKWCAAYFDEGQASWQLPDRNLSPYAAWRAAMRHDRNPEAMGISGFRAAIAGLPDDPVDTIAAVVEMLGTPRAVIGDYLYRALFDIGGWAAYARYRVWDNALYGRTDSTLAELLAIRMAWGYALFLERRDLAFRTAWAESMAQAAQLPAPSGLVGDAELVIDLVAQNAYERAFQRRLLAKLAAGPEVESGQLWPRRGAARKSLQAAFCIDVRSEVYRRALEKVCPDAQTIGFAGFFGYSIEYVPIGRDTGGAQCPVLLTPAFTVCESVATASPDEETEILGLRLLRRRATKAWKSFKLSAVSSFTFVETAGPLFAAKLVGDSIGETRPVTDPNTDGLDAAVIDRVGPRLEARTVRGRATGFTPAQALAQAEAVLRGMSLTRDFARLVMLAGHGSTTANNPHASGLDCGACGGHTGEANARVAAGILNDPDVRRGLRGKGIDIPEDSWFLGCLHDTTTDEVSIFDQQDIPPQFAPELAELKIWLAQASQLARTERARLLGVADAADVDAAVIRRSHDWSQVRPEWGLAGNAAFIAAPRRVTHGVDLGGRAFLHSYDWQDDAGFGVLKLIMTAPMVVASWINLQYYGSTVNNRAFGSGNKALHNVVGTLGVLEGNGGDLKTGLPWQSVHDGTRFIHEPLRLNVFIAAPVAAVNEVIMASQAVRELVDNRWIHLFAMDDGGRVTHRYDIGGAWVALG